jgi:hypothetical protein
VLKRKTRRSALDFLRLRGFNPSWWFYALWFKPIDGGTFEVLEQALSVKQSKRREKVKTAPARESEDA